MNKWLKIKGFRGYEIDIFGNVRSYRTNGGNLATAAHELKPSFRNGYKSVVLHKDGKKIHKNIHRLLALHFLENKNNKPYVCHRNGKKLDNRLSNLYWGNNSENQLDAVKHRTAPGLKSYSCKLNEKQVRVIKHILNIPKHISQLEIAKIFNVTQSVISRISNRRTWKHIII